MKEEIGAIRTSPSRAVRSSSLGADITSGYEATIFSRVSRELTAIMMLHGPNELLNIKIFTRKLQNTAYIPVRIPFEIPEEARQKLEGSKISKPGLFFLEANYGDIGSEIPNSELIQYVLMTIQPIHLILFSATQKCLDSAMKEFEDTAIQNGVKMSSLICGEALGKTFSSIVDGEKPRKLSSPQ